MKQAKQGDRVRVHYTGKLQDGTIFDTSRSRAPLQFTIGEGRIIAGFEQAVVGMNTGETRTVTVPVDQGYGNRRDDMIVTINRDQLPADIKPEKGQRLQLTQKNDEILLVTVADFSDTTITLDANHPLAGKELTFEIELLAFA